MAGRTPKVDGAPGDTQAKTAPVPGRNDTQGDPKSASKSGAIATAGVRTGEDFANLMSALMSDIIEGAITPNVANATVNAGGKLLKVVEMQYRYGSPKTSPALTLVLAPFLGK